MGAHIFTCVALYALAAGGTQNAAPPQQAGSTTAASAPVIATRRCTDCIPALTPVELVIDADLGSKISTTGATFPIHLDKPIIVDGRELAPAGAQGEGEVIHAKKAGGMGASGELVLAARYIRVNGQPLALRSMRVTLAGKDAIQEAGAATLIFTPAMFLVSGGNVVVAKGTVVPAKTAADFSPAPPVSAASVKAIKTGE